jgi:HEAT repeat protein
MPQGENVVWGWFSALGDTKAMARRRQRAWESLLCDHALAAACREAITLGSTDLLERAWSCVAREEVTEAVTYFCRSREIASARLLGGVLGTVAAAQSVRAARDYDLPALVRWVHEAAAAWGGGSAERRGLAEAVAWQKGLGPETILDEHFCALARLAPGQWQVGAARESVRSLLGLGPRRAVRSLELPLMAYRNGEGVLLRLHVDLLAVGFGEFYDEPASLGLVPFTADFLKAVNTAWALAGRQPAERPRAGPEAKPGPTLAAMLGPRDVRWRLEGTNLDTLDGESLGLGLTVALVQLLRDDPLDKRCAVTGAIDENGNVVKVNHVREKVAAAWEQREAPGRPVITRLVVPAANLGDAANGAPGSGHVRGVTHMPQALEEASGLLDAACTLLRRQVAALDEECKKRTDKSLEQQFVSVRVARGLRPRLRPEDYEQLERQCRQGDYSARNRQLRDRNEMLREAETQGRLERPRQVVPWEQVRERLRRGAIVGDPGFGKTMLLWHEVRRRCAKQLELALQQKAGPDDIDLAVFLRANELQPMMARRGGQPLGEVLLAWLAARTAVPALSLEWLRTRLKEGGIFLAVDALEEVPADERDDALAALKEYAGEYPAAPLLVSSRLVNYTGCPFPVAEEDEVELLSFDPEKVGEAVRQWFGDDRARAEELLAHLNTQPAVRAMLRSPLLLRLACQSATRSLAAGRPLRLWQRPTELFDDLIENATEVWVEKTPHKPTKKQRARFAQFASWVAWLLWREDPGRTLFTQKGLCDAVEAAAARYPAFADRPDAIQDLCDAGVIVPAGPDGPGTPFLFTHRTAQEYRAARALGEQPDVVETALARVYDTGWHPVLQYLGAALEGPRVWEYVRSLLLRNADDLLCRPFRLAVHTVMNADPRKLPAGLPEEVSRRVVAMYLHQPDWLGWDILPLLTACGPRAVPSLIRALRECKSDEACRLAAVALGVLQAREAVPLLLDTLCEATYYYFARSASAWALGVLRAREAIPQLLQILWKADRPNGRLSLSDLPTLSSYSGEDEIMLRMLRATAAAALWTMQAHESLPALLQAFRESNASVECAALAWALAANQDKQSEMALLETLTLREAKDPSIRRRFTAALGALRVPEAVPMMLRALREDQDAEVRKASAEALGALQKREAVPMMLRALREDQDAEVRRVSAAALGALQAREAVPALMQAFRADQNDQVRRASAEALGALQASEAVPSLLRALRHFKNDSLCAAGAIAALGALQAREAVPVLLRVLRNRKMFFLPSAAAAALGALQSQDAIPALLQALRRGKLKEIQLRRSREAVPDWAQLPNFQEIEDRGVRRSAACALASMEKHFPEGVPIASAGLGMERELREWNADLRRALSLMP